EIFPRLAHPRLDVRLRDVIDDEALLWESANELQRGREPSRIDQDVVRELELAERSDPALEVRAKQEVIRLGLDDVAKADQLGLVRKLFYRGAHVGRAEVDPPHHALDEVVLARKPQVEQGLV